LQQCIHCAIGLLQQRDSERQIHDSQALPQRNGRGRGTRLSWPGARHAAHHRRCNQRGNQAKRLDSDPFERVVVASDSGKTA